MLSAAGSPLVAGSAAIRMTTVFIRVIRAFYRNREIVPVGAVIEVSRPDASGLIASGKAVSVPKPAPAAEPTAIVAKPLVNPVPRKRGKKDAE